MRSTIDYFESKLAFETDVADVAAALATENPGFVLIDSRGQAAWDQGRIPNALHLPTAELAARSDQLDPEIPVVTYCWGPGCNGATKSALQLARLGFQVREMIGGFEYWVREGGAVETDAGRQQADADLLTAPAGTLPLPCGC